jgi:hypothetical protein
MKEIVLKSGEVTLVDDEDFEFLNQWKWYKSGSGYATRSEGTRRVRTFFWMHRVVLGTPNGMLTDHKDRNKLNNQRSNLRICTPSQNGMNILFHHRKGSRFKGVHVRNDRPNKYYRASIYVNGKSISRTFPFTREGEILAGKAYNELAKKYFGEFACLNPL